MYEPHLSPMYTVTLMLLLTLILQTLHFLTSSLRVEGSVCLEISSTHCWAMGAGEIIRVAGDGMAGCNQIKKFVPAA